MNQLGNLIILVNAKSKKTCTKVATVCMNSFNLKEKMKLIDLNIRYNDSDQRENYIYKFRVDSINKSLGAIFGMYSNDRKPGFLPIRDITPEYLYMNGIQIPQGIYVRDITEYIRQGDEFLVQIDKDERGNKGAVLTTKVCVSGPYLVLCMDSRAGGVSRRIDEKERENLLNTLKKLQEKVPSGMGLIMRTASVGRSIEECEKDLENLSGTLDSIIFAGKKTVAPGLVYREGGILMRIIRDYLRDDISEIIVDDTESYESVKKYAEKIKPEFVNRIKLYSGKTEIFNSYGVDTQVESIYERKVNLTSGGSIVLDMTEAGAFIDVNSAKSNRYVNIEDTALNTNIEAAEEIARQIRIRDLGGIIVIDFIDMESVKNKNMVHNALCNALQSDRARTNVGYILPKFGVLVMTRQRLNSPTYSAVQVQCPCCMGQGTIRSFNSVFSNMVDTIENKANNSRVFSVRITASTMLADMILNDKRRTIFELEKEYEMSIYVRHSSSMQYTDYEIQFNIDNMYEQDSDSENEYDEELKQQLQNKKNIRTVAPVSINEETVLDATNMILSESSMKKRKKEKDISNDTNISIIGKIGSYFKNIFKGDSLEELDSKEKESYISNKDEQIPYSEPIKVNQVVEKNEPVKGRIRRGKFSKDYERDSNQKKRFDRDDRRNENINRNETDRVKKREYRQNNPRQERQERSERQYTRGRIEERNTKGDRDGYDERRRYSDRRERDTYRSRENDIYTQHDIKSMQNEFHERNQSQSQSSSPVTFSFKLSKKDTMGDVFKKNDTNNNNVNTSINTSNTNNAKLKQQSQHSGDIVSNAIEQYIQNVNNVSQTKQTGNIDSTDSSDGKQ